MGGVCVWSSDRAGVIGRWDYVGVELARQLGADRDRAKAHEAAKDVGAKDVGAATVVFDGSPAGQRM